MANSSLLLPIATLFVVLIAIEFYATAQNSFSVELSQLDRQILELQQRADQLRQQIANENNPAIIESDTRTLQLIQQEINRLQTLRESFQNADQNVAQNFG
ncbi:hypothetical protein niasHS_009239 [Heterodera schachtii]|uniref:Uncharacterized protein n=2 Tax=Heterodera TaxID=34509 RepID=A0ABD2J6T4_HETSC